MPAFVHSIVLRVYADMNEGFMTCSIYGGSRAHTFRTRRGERIACVAIVVWWLENYQFFGEDCLSIIVVANNPLTTWYLWTEVHLGKHLCYLVDEVITFRRLPVWLRDLDPVIYTYVYVYIYTYRYMHTYTLWGSMNSLTCFLRVSFLGKWMA